MLQSVCSHKYHTGCIGSLGWATSADEFYRVRRSLSRSSKGSFVADGGVVESRSDSEAPIDLSGSTYND